MMQSEALGLVRNLAQLRFMIIEQASATVLQPLLLVMVFLDDEYFRQLGPVFTRERGVSNDLFVAALCVSGAIFLILELYTPYKGLLRISSAPLRVAYDSLVQ